MSHPHRCQETNTVSVPSIPAVATFIIRITVATTTTHYNPPLTPAFRCAAAPAAAAAFASDGSLGQLLAMLSDRLAPFFETGFEFFVYVLEIGMQTLPCWEESARWLSDAAWVAAAAAAAAAAACLSTIM